MKPECQAAIDSAFDFFEKHPEKWTTGSYFRADQVGPDAYDPDRPVDDSCRFCFVGRVAFEYARIQGAEIVWSDRMRAVERVEGECLPRHAEVIGANDGNDNAAAAMVDVRAALARPPVWEEAS